MTYILVAIIALLQVADGWTTWQIIRFGGYEEDPFTKRVLEFFGVYWGLMIEKCAVAFVFWYLRETIPPIVMYGTITLFVGVVVNNLQVLKKQKQ